MSTGATTVEVIVKPHPAGGWTHARREAGAGCFVYSGNWPTARAATRALGALAERPAPAVFNFGAVMAGASRNSGGEHGGHNPAAALSSTPGVGLPAPLAVAGRAEALFPVISGLHWSRGLALGLRAHGAASQRLRAAVAQKAQQVCAPTSGEILP